MTAKNFIFFGNYFHKIFIRYLSKYDSENLGDLSSSVFVSVTGNRLNTLLRILSIIIRSWCFRDVCLWVPQSSAYIYRFIFILSFGKSFIYSDGLADIIDTPSRLFLSSAWRSNRSPYTLSSSLQYIRILRQYYSSELASPLQVPDLCDPFVVVSLKCPAYLDSNRAAHSVNFAIEYALAFSFNRGCKLILSSHKSFDRRVLRLDIMDQINSASCSFVEAPIVNVLVSPFCLMLVSLPSGVIADAIALPSQPEVVLLDPRAYISSLSSNSRISVYIDVLLSLSTDKVSVVSF
jgi:hypothetical protein